MALTKDQRAEKIAKRLFMELVRIQDLDDSVRDLVYTKTIEKLDATRMTITAQGIRQLRTLSLEIGV